MAQISPERRAILEKEKARNRSSDRNFFSMKGKNRAVIRVVSNDLEPIGTKVVSYFIGDRSFVCNQAVHGKPGVIARVISALAKVKDKAIAAEAHEYKAALEKNRRTNFLMKIVDMGDEEKKVMWYRAPRQVYDPIYAASGGDGDALNSLEEGMNIRISKEGEMLQTEYDIRIMGEEPISTSRKEINRIRAEADALSIDDMLAPDEAGALEAIKKIIGKAVWNAINEQVLEGLDLGGHDEDSAATGDDDDTPAPKKKVVAEDDDAPAPKKKVVVDDDDTPPPAKKKAVVDDDEEPVRPAKKAAVAEDDAPPAKKKVVDDDEDTPVVKKKAAVVDDDDAPVAKKKAAVVDDDDAPVVKKKVVTDDEEEPVVKKKVVTDDEDAPVVKKKKPVIVDDE